MTNKIYLLVVGNSEFHLFDIQVCEDEEMAFDLVRTYAEDYNDFILMHSPKSKGVYFFSHVITDDVFNHWVDTGEWSSEIKKKLKEFFLAQC